MDLQRWRRAIAGAVVDKFDARRIGCRRARQEELLPGQFVWYRPSTSALASNASCENSGQ